MLSRGVSVASCCQVLARSAGKRNKIRAFTDFNSLDAKKTTSNPKY